MAIDESSLSKGNIRKLNALRKSLGNTIAEDAFARWLAEETPPAPKADPVAERIVEALSGMEDDRSFNLGRYGYTVRRAKGKGRSGFVAMRNEKTD